MEGVYLAGYLTQKCLANRLFPSIRCELKVLSSSKLEFDRGRDLKSFSSFFGRCFLALALVLLVAPSAQAVEPTRQFQVDVVPITTSLGTPVVTQAESQALIDRVNAGMNDATGGVIRFTLRSVLPTIAPGAPVTTSTDVGKVSGITPKADPGFESAILIGVIVEDRSLPFAGMAGGQYMLVNYAWDRMSSWILTHEFGHNLGLLHANSATCTTALPIVCEQLEYGDYSSVMGDYVYAYVAQPYIARFSATELDKLKVLPSNERSIATETGEYKLAPVYSTNLDIPKVLYIPIGNENAYSVEYRPAIEGDSSLAQTKISLSNGGFYTNIQSHGLQLRIIQTVGTDYLSLLPKTSNKDRFGTGLVSDTLKGPQLQPLGKTLLLSDGSTVTFVSADPNVGAVVKIVRPADTEAPKISNVTARMPDGTYYRGPNGEYLIKHKTPTEWDYPILMISLSGATDNRLLKSLELEINGQIVSTISGSSITTVKELTYQTTSVGNFAIRVIATDYSGNKSQSEISNYATDYYYLSKPGVGTEIGPDPLTSVKFSFYKANDDVTYQVSELSAGTLKSIEVSKRLVEVTVVDIPRNTTITAKLIGSNASGETDGGQIISGAPEIAECTNSICYVGLPWKIETGFFTPGSGVMSLQVKIGGKWVPIKSSKPILGKSPYKKYPVGYEISLSYSAPGKHTYRLVIAPSKKLSSYTGPAFTQVVKP
jgi:hypothetical protein